MSCIRYPAGDIRDTPIFGALGNIWMDGVTPIEDALKKVGVSEEQRSQAQKWWVVWTATQIADEHHPHPIHRGLLTALRRAEFINLLGQNFHEIQEEEDGV